MDRHDDHAQTAQLAKGALVAMRERSIPPTPENFLVWYTVAAGHDPALTRVVQVLDGQTAPYDEERCHELHARFFGESRQNGLIDGIAGRIETRLQEIKALLGAVIADAAAYDARLGGFAESLRTDLDIAALTQAVGSLREATQHLHGSAGSWHSDAHKHREEMQRLRRDLADARNAAETDTLTGIGNRKRFDRRFRQLAAAACENGEPLCLLLADIDHFKSFNDNYGHALGDKVLALVGRKLSELNQTGVEAFRYGGEEFAILTPGLQIMEAVELAEQLRRNVAAARLARRNGGEPLRQITVSIGLSAYEPGEPLARLLERSDAALYAAKGSGRNRTSLKRAKRSTAA